jgi:hypothetical protein
VILLDSFASVSISEVIKWLAYVDSVEDCECCLVQKFRGIRVPCEGVEHLSTSERSFVIAGRVAR